YHLDPARSDPEVVAILRRSKRVLLPTLAQRHYDQAMSAYDAGDAYRAISEGERASALLADSDLDDPPADLKAAIANVLALARPARTTLEERVYPAADRDVTPPRALGRQLPAAPSPATPQDLIGHLEIVVDRSGSVETVRLFTPLNGYHDRMIVSAAKAWHYTPALRNGRPVRFRMVMAINLPES